MKDLAESLSTGVDRDLVAVKKETQSFSCESDVLNKQLWNLFGWEQLVSTVFTKLDFNIL